MTLDAATSNCPLFDGSICCTRISESRVTFFFFNIGFYLNLTTSSVLLSFHMTQYQLLGTQDSKKPTCIKSHTMNADAKTLHYQVLLAFLLAVGELHFFVVSSQYRFPPELSRANFDSIIHNQLLIFKKNHLKKLRRNYK
jgi:hypothetical protein